MEQSNFKLVEFDGGNITIIKDDEAFMIKCFRELIQKDTGMPGDFDGRKKLKSSRELAYIIYMNDPIRSPGLRAGYIGKRLQEDAIYQLQLPDGWEPHDLLNECERAYQIYIEGVNTEMYRNILASLGNNNKITQYINEQIADKLLSGLTNEEIDDVSKKMRTLISIANDYESQVEALKKAEYNARKERTEIKKAKGGKSIAPSMDPKNAVN